MEKLGNLKLEDFEKEFGVHFTKAERKFLENHHYEGSETNSVEDMDSCWRIINYPEEVLYISRDTIGARCYAAFNKYRKQINSVKRIACALSPKGVKA